MNGVGKLFSSQYRSDSRSEVADEKRFSITPPREEGGETSCR